MIPTRNKLQVKQLSFTETKWISQLELRDLNCCTVEVRANAHDKMRASRISSRTIQITARMRSGWPWRLGKPRVHGCPCVPKLASCWLIRRGRFIGRKTHRHDSQILARLASGDGVARTTGKGCTWKKFLLGGRSAPPDTRQQWTSKTKMRLEPGGCTDKGFI